MMTLDNVLMNDNQSNQGEDELIPIYTAWILWWKFIMIKMMRINPKIHLGFMRIKMRRSRMLMMLDEGEDDYDKKDNDNDKDTKENDIVCTSL